MQIMLNGAPVNINGEITTLANLIQQIKKQHIDKRSILTEINVDGKETDLSMNDLEISESSSIEVISALPQDLASKSINNLTEHISNILSMLAKASDKFRTEGEEEANKYYSECLDALQLFSEVMDGVGQMLNLDYSKIETDEGNIADEIVTTQNLFEAMHDAQKQKDWVLLADVIEYELIPVMKNWIGSFASILLYIKNACKTGGE